MKYDTEKHHRRSIRLKDYDYSHPGAYFVTICVNNKECLFGEILEGNLRYSKIGIVAGEVLIKTVNSMRLMQLDSYVIMPNHIHMIVFIENNDENHEGVTPKNGAGK